MWAFQHVAPSGLVLSAGSSVRSFETRFDNVGDVLYLDIDPAETPTGSELDEEEIFVFRNSHGAVIAFVIPYFQKYWIERIDSLIRHISVYLPDDAAALTSALRQFH